MHNGDTLEDDYNPDDLVAQSDDDAVSLIDDEEEFTGLGSPGETHPERRSSALDAEEAAKAKKRKRREKEKEKKAKKRRMIETTASSSNESHSDAAQSPALLAEYISKSQARTHSKMSAVELDDIRIPESAIADTSTWTAPRTLDTLGDFIAKVVPVLKTRLAQKSKDSGAPTLLFIAGNALRVADVTRVFKSKTLRGEKGGDVAKLFARHFKVEDHVTYLKRTKIGVAVGTPGRLGKLLCDTDALSLSALTHIMFDVTYHDVKKRSIFDIQETRDEIFKTVLGAEGIRDAIRRNKVQLVLF